MVKPHILMNGWKNPDQNHSIGHADSRACCGRALCCGRMTVGKQSCPWVPYKIHCRLAGRQKVNTTRGERRPPFHQTPNMDFPTPITEQPEDSPQNSRDIRKHWMQRIVCILLVIVTIISFCPAMLSVTRILDFVQSDSTTSEQQVDGVRFQMKLARMI